MIKAKLNDIPEILNHLKKDIVNCLYLYLDITTYGLSNPNLNIWYEKDFISFKIIVMKYFDCFQIYSCHNDFFPENIVWLAEKYNINRVFSRKDTIEILRPFFSSSYAAEYGKIVELNKYKNFHKDDLIREAELKDIPEIVELLLTDRENNVSYSYDGLNKQFTSLLETHMGRCYVIEENNKILAHLSVSAETDEFMIASYTIVHPQCRNNIYGTFLDSFLINRIKGNKRLFAFMTEQRRIHMFQVMGNSVVAEYGKLIKST